METVPTRSIEDLFKSVHGESWEKELAAFRDEEQKWSFDKITGEWVNSETGQRIKAKEA